MESAKPSEAAITCARVAAAADVSASAALTVSLINKTLQEHFFFACFSAQNSWTRRDPSLGLIFGANGIGGCHRHPSVRSGCCNAVCSCLREIDPLASLTEGHAEVKARVSFNKKTRSASARARVHLRARCRSATPPNSSTPFNMSAVLSN